MKKHLSRKHKNEFEVVQAEEEKKQKVHKRTQVSNLSSVKKMSLYCNFVSIEQ